jgi:hypothetical protein
MKKLTLIIAFVIINVSFIGAQNMLLKKTTSTSFNNSIIYDYYKYSVDWKLDSVVRVTQQGDTMMLFLFENDSLKTEIQPNYIFNYVYYGSDSIVQFTSMYPNWENYKSGIYYINSDFEMISYNSLYQNGNISGTTYYTYENGNCTKILYNGGQIGTTDYSSFNNPYLNEKKYFRRGFQGSVNFLEHDSSSNYQLDVVVNASLNNYPEMIDNYIDDELNSTMEFEYYNFTDITPIHEIIEILEVTYYNLLGQKIDKPLKGFYIERISTPEGLFSKKKYAFEK